MSLFTPLHRCLQGLTDAGLNLYLSKFVFSTVSLGGCPAQREELDKRLKKNGWDWFLFSNLTPGIVRLQMGAAVETLTEWRKCFEAPTLEEAVTNKEVTV